MPLFAIVSCEGSKEIRVIDQSTFRVIGFQVVPKGFAFVFRYCVVANVVMYTIRERCCNIYHRRAKVEELGADEHTVCSSCISFKVGVVYKSILLGVVRISLDPFSSLVVVYVVSVKGLEASVHHRLLVLEARILPILVKGNDFIDLGHINEFITCGLRRVAYEIVSHFGALPDSWFTGGKRKDTLERIRGKTEIPGDDI